MESKMKQSFTVIYINSEFMGNGDDGLGDLLMGNFLSTLGDFVKEVSHILLVNSGVKLSCAGSNKVDVMKMLEESGVEILSCGTCLNSFDLANKIRAGKISNMFTILEIITRSEKILTP